VDLDHLRNEGQSFTSEPACLSGHSEPLASVLKKVKPSAPPSEAGGIGVSFLEKMSSSPRPSARKYRWTLADAF